MHYGGGGGTSLLDSSGSEPASGSNASRPQEDYDFSDRLASGSNAAKEKTVFFDFNGEEKRFDRSEGSSDVVEVRVPTLAYDDTSITLVWDKPEKYDDVANYYVYRDGEKIGDARSNFAEHADWAATYMEAFYDYYEKEKSSVDMVDVDIHSFKATGLEPDTEYEFEVVAVDDSGVKLGDAGSISWSTTETPEEFNIKDYGAKPVEAGYTTYDEEKNAFILANTKAIQAAIDDCSEGGRVVIPEGIWMSGAIYLKSNMTLELKEGAVLFGSPNVDHYDQNYLLYPYSTDTRSWALVNAYSSDENGMLENIRIVGKGTIYGNGWKYGEKDTISGDGTSPFYQSKMSGDPDWTKEGLKEYALKRWVAGSNSKVYDKNNPGKSYGILAADASKKGQEKGLTASLAYSTRPNLVVLRGTKGVYLEGFMAENPAFHTVAILDSEDVACSNVKFSTYDVNNADGIEIGNTQNVMIFNNFINTGDDGINFATGMGKGVQDSEQQASANIWTFNNFLRECHGGAIAAGSHTGAGINNMLVEDNVMNHSDMPFRFKSAPVNGGGVSDILIRDCAVSDAQQVFVLSTTYSDANQTVSVEPADKPAEFKNIQAYNITADGITKNTMSMVADIDNTMPYKTYHTHHDLYFQDIAFTNISSSLAKKSEELKGISDATFYDVTMDWAGIAKEEDDAQATAYKAWGSISNSTGLKFLGSTTLSTSAYNAMAVPAWEDDAELKASPSNAVKAGYTEARAELTWPSAKDGEQPYGSGSIAGYVVETYIDDVMIDRQPLIKGNTYTADGLSTALAYTFHVYAVDATGNRSEPLTAVVTTEGDEDTAGVSGPENKKLTFSGIGYTWGTASFQSAKKTDARVRGYRAYVNDELAATIYNYQLKDGAAAASLSATIGRMMEQNNEVRLEAFTDAGLTFEYETASVTTTENYDHLAPVWTDDTLEVQVNGSDIVLTWTAPEDESGIYGYRVYVDGKGIYNNDSDYFNHVNGAYTTKNTAFTVSGLDVTEYHTFRVEAADAWWKALNGSGPFHWTFSGPSASIGTKPEDKDNGLWKAVAFGQSTDLNFSSNVLPEKVGTNYVWPVGSDTPLTEKGEKAQDVVIESRGGKIQSGHDGLTFYYTEVPTNKNFVLSADVTVEHMGPENGKAPNLQEGAGLMVRDVNGPARKDPLEEGYEEYPAASNMVMLEVLAAGKSVNAGLSVKAMARYGVNSPAGNLKTPTPGSTFAANVAAADNSQAPEDAPYKTNFYNAKMKLTLERTDEGFIESYTGADGTTRTYSFTDKNVTPNIVAHLDEEIMNVGFFASRNARIRVENISLVLSDVENPDETPAYVAPNEEGASLFIASSDYTNNGSYTLQGMGNLDGTVSVIQDGRTIADAVPVTGGVQFTVPASVTGDSSEFTVLYTASEGKDEGLEKKASVTVKRAVYGKELYASPEGTDEGDGTRENPMSIAAAVRKVVPGGTVYMMEGTYSPFTIPYTASGNEEDRKSLTAEGSVVITGGSGKLFVLDSDYWNVTGLDVDGKNVNGSRGFMIHGSHNIIESCLIHDTSSDAGLTITKSRGSRSLWPSYNLVKNCESYRNRDESGINADGFASKSCSGDDNRFVNCVSHDNADDGWDLYNTLQDGANGRTIIENCVAYGNGNNGFKLGGEGREVAHVLKNSVAFHNGLDGITDNFNPGALNIQNNTSFDNTRFNIILRPSPYKTDAEGSLTADGTVKNNVSYRTEEFSAGLDKVYDDKISAIIKTNNFLYAEGKNSVDADNFVSFDEKNCFSWNDGTIVFGDFLKIAKGSELDLAGAGARLSEDGSSDMTLEELVADMAANPDNYTADQIFNAVTDYDAETIYQAVKNDEAFAENLSILEEAYMEKKGIEIVIAADDDIAGEIDIDRMRVIGAAFNSNGRNVTVKLSKPVKDGAVDGNKYDTILQVEITLQNVTGVLAVPVTLVMPVPGGADGKEFKVLHYHNGSLKETITPELSGDGLFRMTVKEFSTFVFVTAKSEPTPNPDPRPDPEPTPNPDHNSGHKSSGGGSSRAVTSGVQGSWKQDSRGWWFQKKSGGYPANEWCDIAGQWYYFNGEGYMVTGWQLLNGVWYYLKPDGAMLTGWLSSGDKWYYLNADGSMATGWVKLSGKWYYLNQNGDMETASKEIEGKVYSFDENGACVNP